jgi:ABC-type glutathione transport system ATPase component
VSTTSPSGKVAPLGTGAAPGTQPILRVEDLSIGFGGSDVVHGISFEIAAGQTLGVVGESGSGKSVTALAVLRLLPAETRVSGRILFTASATSTTVDLLDLPEREMRLRRGSDVAMVFQEPMTALNPVMRVGSQIAEAVRAHQPELSSKAVDRLVLDASSPAASGSGF